MMIWVIVHAIALEPWSLLRSQPQDAARMANTREPDFWNADQERYV
jgi:hypothetical protein